MPQQHTGEPSSLRGSLDTFSIPDVLSLLGATGHTGALEVSGDGTVGRVFVEDGAVVAADTGPVDMPVDVVVELLRLEQGSFSFASGEVPDRPGPPVAVPDLLAEARARLEEWYAIEAVLPSVEHEVVLAPDPPTDEIVMSGEQWRALAAIGAGGPVGLLFDRLADDELEALRLLKGLVDLGLLEVVEPAIEPPPRPAPEAPPEPQVIVVRAARPAPRVVDPCLEARLDALSAQFDRLYEEAQAAEPEELEVPTGHGSLFGKLRHRHGH